MAEERVTYCRICEPFCGMIATVEDDRLVGLRPDQDHPLTQVPEGDGVHRGAERASGGTWETREG